MEEPYSPPPLKIELPFTPESVLQVLEWGVNPAIAPCSHKDIAEWCDRFWCQYIDIDGPPEIERLLSLLTTVETQWDLYLINTYSMVELRALDLDTIQIPTEWFKEWLNQAKA